MREHRVSLTLRAWRISVISCEVRCRLLYAVATHDTIIVTYKTLSHSSQQPQQHGARHRRAFILSISHRFQGVLQ